MAKSISEYYLTNYTQCTIDDSFLASWQGLAYGSHFTQCIAIPIQALTFYLIICKTPKTMSSVKTPLLVAHFCCAFLDFSVGTLCTPYMFFPATAIFGVGILNLFNVPMLVLFVIGGAEFVAMMISLIYLFESRSSSIILNKFRFTSRSCRAIYYFLLFLIHSSLLLFGFVFPKDQETAKLELLITVPCPTREFFTEPVYVALSDTFWIKVLSLFAIPSLVVIDLLQLVFFMGCSIYHLYIAPSISSSQRTRQLQRHFFIGILAQAVVPLSTFAVTYAVIMMLYAIDNMSQSVMNMAFVIYGVHGTVESFVIILVHEVYRKEVCEIFRIK